MEDIVLITCDSLRQSNISLYGYNRETTPFLDSKANDAIIYPNAFSVGPASYCMSGVLTSTLPLTQGAYYTIPQGLETIADALPTEYTSIGLHSNSYFSSDNGYGGGFDIYMDLGEDGGEAANHSDQGLQSKTKRLTRLITKKSDTLYSLIRSLYTTYKRRKTSLNDPRVGGWKVNKKVETLLQEAESPIFLWIHYMDTHSPYLSDMDILKEFNPNITRRDVSNLTVFRNERETTNREDERVEKLVDLYDAEVRRMDGILEDLFQERLGDLDSPTILLSADHGEGFGEHGYLGHQARALYDETLHVPLVLINPPSSQQRGHIENSITSTLDIAPTICDVAGTSQPDTFQGTSLLENSNTGNGTAYSVSSHSEGGEVNPRFLNIRFRNEDIAYIYRESGDDEVYTIPEDTEPNANFDRQISEVQESIYSIRDRLQYSASDDLDVGAADEERLRALGYLE